MGATRLDDAEELQERQEPIASTSRRTISALEDEHMILSKHNPQYDSGDDGSDEAAARCHQDEQVGFPKVLGIGTDSSVQTLQRKSKEGYQCERKNEGGHNVDGVNEDICQGLEELRV